VVQNAIYSNKQVVEDMNELTKQLESFVGSFVSVPNCYVQMLERVSKLQ
jgi:hypothetical protein